MGTTKTVIQFSCGCGHKWNTKPQAGKGVACPKCGSSTELSSRKVKTEDQGLDNGNEDT